MTSSLPDKLKSADIGRFALRASQLETAKPAVAYWCEYWIVNQLLARQLHSADAECLQYTTNLMDKLEQTKQKYANDAAVVDDAAGQAYVQQFGLETFERADRAVQASRVTKQTADTFLAASTFLELLNIWGNPSPEIHAKIRYAKWNAVRIVRAIKEGKDPNESNPKPEPEPEQEPELAALDPNDPEVQALGGSSESKQPTVEEVPDEQDQIQPFLAATSTQDYSLHPSAQPSAVPSPGPSPLPKEDTYAPEGAGDDVSPLEESPHPRDGSVGGGYFPEVPSGTRSPVLPSAPTHIGSPPTPDLSEPGQLPAPIISTSDVADDAQDFYRTAPAPASDTIPTITADEPTAPPTQTSVPAPPPVQQSFPPPPTQPYHQPPNLPANVPPPILRRPQVPTAPVTQPPPPASPATVPSTQPSSNRAAEVYKNDDVSIAKAQKHARWAISALNFDDAATAVRELREALKTLGAEI